jgi:hypothetical protein
LEDFGPSLACQGRRAAISIVVSYTAVDASNEHFKLFTLSTPQGSVSFVRVGESSPDNLREHRADARRNGNHERLFLQGWEHEGGNLHSFASRAINVKTRYAPPCSLSQSPSHRYAEGIQEAVPERKVGITLSAKGHRLSALLVVSPIITPRCVHDRYSHRKSLTPRSLVLFRCLFCLVQASFTGRNAQPRQHCRPHMEHDWPDRTFVSALWSAETSS